MYGKRTWYSAALAALLALSGCDAPDGDSEHPSLAIGSREGSEEDVERLEREMDAARELIVARIDSVREALTSVRGLSRAERSDLRRDVNARQVAIARSLGIRARSQEAIERMIRDGELVELEDTTELWVVRELDYSAPYVTPDTRAMLVELGERFRARLDTLGLPRYRMEITSVLRTPKNQADLRRRNANAASGVSAHEFGTTVDVAHARFAAPTELKVEMPSSPGAETPMRLMEALVMEELAREHVSGLQGELGRVLRAMREEGKVRVMMERRQAVYHMTVARRFPASAAAD